MSDTVPGPEPYEPDPEYDPPTEPYPGWFEDPLVTETQLFTWIGPVATYSLERGRDPDIPGLGELRRHAYTLKLVWSKQYGRYPKDTHSMKETKYRYGSYKRMVGWRVKERMNWGEIWQLCSTPNQLSILASIFRRYGL